MRQVEALLACALVVLVANVGSSRESTADDLEKFVENPSTREELQDYVRILAGVCAEDVREIVEMLPAEESLARESRHAEWLRRLDLDCTRSALGSSEENAELRCRADRIREYYLKLEDEISRLQSKESPTSR